MSSSRPARKIFSTISTLQKLRLQNKPACERPKNKFLSWLSFRWPGANQETLDGLDEKFDSTGIISDSIFIHSKQEATSIHKEALITSDSTCPAASLAAQQTSQLHPELTDLESERCELPIDSKKVKGPVIGVKKSSIQQLEHSANKFHASAGTKYEGLKTQPLQGYARNREQPCWKVTENIASAKKAKTAGPIDPPGVHTYRIKSVTSSSLTSPINALKVLYSKKGTTEKPKKPHKKDDVPEDWLKSKSPNDCKKRRGKCDPNIKPFKNAGSSTASPMVSPSTPMTPRVTEPGPLAVSFATHRRFYSDKKEVEATDSKPEATDSKPEATDSKPEACAPEGETQASEPTAVVETHRCAKSKCGPESVACPKPVPINQHRCPKKPVPAARRKKRVKPVADAKKAE